MPKPDPTMIGRRRVLKGAALALAKVEEEWLAVSARAEAYA